MFGLYLPQLRMEFPTIEARALAAEECGFHSVWFMDHLVAPAARTLDTLEAWTVATAVAAATCTIRVGHLVLCDPFRHPALLAKMASTLDVISDGRLELGLGWGSVESELSSFGFERTSARERAGRLRETLEILELMFAGEPFDYDGDYYELHGAIGRPTPVKGRVPIHIGGTGRSLTLPLVERYADWWNCPGYGVSRIDELRAHIGDTRISVQHPVGLARSSVDREEVAAVAARRFGSWGGLITGTAEEVASALAEEASAGVELFVIQFSDFGQPETIELFAKEVIPAVVAR